MTEEEKKKFYEEIFSRVKEVKMQELFEEPCRLYEDEDDT
jgi:hypothetical protein